MLHSTAVKNLFSRFLEALSSRIGINVVVALLVAISLGMGLHTQSAVKQLQHTHASFEERQIRNGYVAMSDFQRLLLVAQEGVHIGEMTAELDAEFRAAADILFVRSDHLRRVLQKGENSTSGEQALNSLEDIVAIADKAIESDYPDLGRLASELLEASSNARTHLVVFLDELRRHAEAVMVTQADVVSKQQMFTLASLGALTLTGIISLILLRKEIAGRRARETAEKRVEFLAFYDPLTLLPNRVQFQDRLQSQIETGQPLALLFIDLDDFKGVNDTKGHAVGDAVLSRVGEVLSETATQNKGFAARLAGDEFALVIPNDRIDDLTSICEQIIADAASPFLYEGQSVSISLSIGLATNTQIGGMLSRSVDGLCRVTDFALYASKSNGRKRYTVYDQSLEKQFLERRAMLAELPRAIENGDLEIHLQPKVELPLRNVTGFEALVRWRRNGQLVAPGEFILLAEESGIVVDIDRYVLKEAVQLLATWNAKHGTELSVSVNLSAVHFTNDRIFEWVEDALWTSGLKPELLTLEMTETLEVRDMSAAEEVMAKLQKLGCRISIDDFGTGFSSLAYVHSTKADELKIDRSLVVELENSAKARFMLRSVIQIGQSFDLDVIVEGVETPEQARIIHEMGATKAQGYFFGRPAAPDAALSEALPDRELQLVVGAN